MANVTVQCGQIIRSTPDEIYAAFVEPGRLTRFWLADASAPLAVGKAVEWTFLVPGAREATTATALEPGRRVEFEWSDGTHVAIAIEASAGSECVVTVALSGFTGDLVHSAANAVEGFSIVLCDLKVLLETGRSPRLVAEKARLIARKR